MRLTPVTLAGAYLIELEPRVDERGFFARSWCSKEFEKAGLPGNIVQTNLSKTTHAGAIRGLHYQRPPSNEGKIVRCILGGIFDVIVDIRPDSDSFLKHFAVELTPSNRLALYVPPGFAHGFQTLEPDTEVWYQMTDFYRPGLGGGIRWDDAALAIDWPREPAMINERDATYPDLRSRDFAVFRGIS